MYIDDTTLFCNLDDIPGKVEDWHVIINYGLKFSNWLATNSL